MDLSDASDSDGKDASNLQGFHKQLSSGETSQTDSRVRRGTVKSKVTTSVIEMPI